jgi:hypothetical protein
MASRLRLWFQCTRYESASLVKVGKDLLASACPGRGANPRAVLENMGAAIVSQKRYVPLLVRKSLEEALSAPDQPRFFGVDLALFQARMMGVEHSLLVATVLEGSAERATSSLPRHVLLHVVPALASEESVRWEARLDACLRNSDVIRQLQETRSSSAFALAIQEAVESPPPASPTQLHRTA